MPSLFKPEAAPKGPGSRVCYPVKLSGIYQAAQNMARNHLSECCPQIHPGHETETPRLALPPRKLQVVVGVLVGSWSRYGTV
jgi:hypothetical protein